MKKLTVIAILLFSVTVFAQEKTKKVDTVKLAIPPSILIEKVGKETLIYDVISGVAVLRKRTKTSK